MTASNPRDILVLLVTRSYWIYFCTVSAILPSHGMENPSLFLLSLHSRSNLSPLSIIALFLSGCLAFDWALLYCSQ